MSTCIKQNLKLFRMRIGIASIIVFVSTSLYGQSGQVVIEDLSKFRSQAGNWITAGSISMNPEVDIHPKEAPAPVESGKKKRKEQTTKVAANLPQALTFEAGKGIILNNADAVKKDHLISSFEHGDIELELEVMLPKGSNSGIYLQGRYEIQLFDSWGVSSPKFSDIGGIYRNWETDPAKAYAGKAPLSNPAKAPGLWQKMRISFRAPRFDEAGNKIQNARFNFVELNGVIIHENVEVPRPTGGPVENNEKPMGPLMIQGDHGPVAIRNMKYTLMGESPVSLKDVTYKSFNGVFAGIDDFKNLKPASEGSLPEFSVDVVENENNYGLIETGQVVIPEDNEYEFTTTFTGGLVLTVGENELVNLQRNTWDTKSSKLQLKQGTYPVTVYNYKTSAWMPPRFSLTIRTANTNPKALHAFNSYPPSDDPTSPIYISPGATPRILRAFLDFRGDRKQRLTHTVGVGEPTAINYVFDLAASNIVCVWRGAFVDATPMWDDRGDGSFKPLGAPQYLFVGPAFAELTGESESFPTAHRAEEYVSKGYTIDQGTGRPIFKSLYKGIEVEHQINPGEGNKMITHLISFKGQQTSNLYFKLAEGAEITKLSNGYYAIDGMQYYIRVDAGSAKVRDTGGKKELYMPVTNNNISYSIIW